jgi:thioredoxin reductase
MSRKRIAIIGAGPIGLEAALHGRALGHRVHVYERESVGENMTRWGHVTLFSSWELNHSSLGAKILREAGRSLPAPDDYLTGRQHVERYLRPLAESEPLSGCVHEGVEVLYVGRDGIGKRDLIGGPRDRHPFRLLLKTREEEEMTEADVVIDCSGTYGNHNWMGNGNIPALGERELSGHIAYTLQDILGGDRERYAGRRVLLVGSGHSAATALDALTQLPGTSVVWIAQTAEKAPLPIFSEDPLPERKRLSQKANALAAGSSPRVEYRPATLVERLARKGERFEVELRSRETPGGRETVEVDRILAYVGYSPDNRIYRELQVHECYASFGPMQLSAALLGESSADCLAATSKGADVLKNPEPNFFVLGSKSYGKNSNFLIRIGLEQVHEIYTLIEKPTVAESRYAS